MIQNRRNNSENRRSIFPILITSALCIIIILFALRVMHVTSSRHTVTIPILLPTKLPSGYVKEQPLGYLRTFVFTLSPRTIFLRLIMLVYNYKNGLLSVFIRPETSFSCTNEKKGGGQTILSSREVSKSLLGSLCIQVYEGLDGTLMESYMWQQSGMGYNIDFPKGMFSQEEIDGMLSSLQPKDTTVVCLLKIVSYYVNIPCDPKPFSFGNL